MEESWKRSREGYPKASDMEIVVSSITDSQFSLISVFLKRFQRIR
jgi:hypothetical protein